MTGLDTKWIFPASPTLKLPSSAATPAAPADVGFWMLDVLSAYKRGRFIFGRKYGDSWLCEVSKLWLLSSGRSSRHRFSSGWAQSRNSFPITPKESRTQAYKIRMRCAVSWVCFVSVSLLTSRVLGLSPDDECFGETATFPVRIRSNLQTSRRRLSSENDSFEIRSRTR